MDLRHESEEMPRALKPAKYAHHGKNTLTHTLKPFLVNYLNMVATTLGANVMQQAYTLRGGRTETDGCTASSAASAARCLMEREDDN